MKKVKVSTRFNAIQLQNLRKASVHRELFLKFGIEMFQNNLLPIEEIKHTGTKEEETTFHLSGIVLTGEEHSKLVLIMGRLKEYISDEDLVTLERILFGWWKGDK